jgi:3-isopropylmalate/(R)-2-methylmalate dehydratase small subunit
MLKISGKALLFPIDSLNTDAIIAGRYLGGAHIDDALPHLFEELRPDFYKNLTKGDIIFSGRNFGAGSTREHAPLLLKRAGIGAIVARSFSRGFYRNGTNLGLFLVESEWQDVADGDGVIIDVGAGLLSVPDKRLKFGMKEPSGIVLQIRESGGLLAFFKDHGDSFSIP